MTACISELRLGKLTYDVTQELSELLPRTRPPFAKSKALWLELTVPGAASMIRLNEPSGLVQMACRGWPYRRLCGGMIFSSLFEHLASYYSPPKDSALSDDGHFLG